MNIATFYAHPDGAGEVWFDEKASRLFLGNESEGQSAWIYIGPIGLRELGQTLIAAAEVLEDCNGK